MKTSIQESKFLSITEVSTLIKQKRILILSGEEELLAQLPKGNWIGGTNPYFYFKDKAGCMDKTQIMVSDFTDLITDFRIQTFDNSELKDICKLGYKNGFNFLILPALQDIHYSFALNAPQYQNLYTNPLIGIIAGVDLAEFAQGRLSKTFNGTLQKNYTDKAVVLQAKLPSEQVARVEIINVFEPTNDITIEVQENTFTVRDCLINGKLTNLYDYIQNSQMDISYPLVCDYAGATINVSFQRLNPDNKEVIFYAPLFTGNQYTTSKKFESYTSVFHQKVEAVFENERNIIYNCNCILNYLYGQLDKSHIGFSGATTFGEIAYHLINQTFTYLAIDEH